MVVKDKEKISDEVRKTLASKKVELFEFSKIKEFYKEKKLKEFLKRWDYFLCDEKIYNKLVKSCQRVFLQRRVLPYPIDKKRILKHDSIDALLQDLYQGIVFLRGEGPIYYIPAARISMDDKSAVKNIMNAIYDFVPQVLVESQKNTTVKLVNVFVKGSKMLNLFSNDFIPDV